MNDKQPTLIGIDEAQTWESEWVWMPEYNNSQQPPPFKTATFKFRNEKDYQEFKDLVREHIYNGDRVFNGTQLPNEKQAWYPLPEQPSNYKYVNGERDES